MKTDRTSSTARLIARALVYLDEEPRLRGLLAPHAAEWSRRFLVTAGTDARFLRWIHLALFRRALAWLERRTLPGILVHYALRKRLIEQCTRAALDQRFCRVLILGAGFDTLTARLASEFPSAEFLEFDHPATQRSKRCAFAAQAMPSNVALHAHDFAAAPEPDWSRFVCGRAADTLVILEGFLMYFPHETVVRLLSALRRLPAGRLHLVFSFMSPASGARCGFANASPLIDAWLAFRGEKMHWCVGPAEMFGFLNGCGFACNQIWDASDLRALCQLDLPADAPLAAGEFLCAATRIDAS